MQENLELMERFFKYNLEMKRILHQTVPKEENLYNKEYSIEYSDKLFQALNDIEYYINVLLEKFDFSENDKNYFNKFIKALKSELINCGYDFYKLKEFYEVCISNMDEKLVNKVGSEIKGGGYLSSGVSLSEAKTINEVMHIVHQTIVNNENNYRNLPIVAQKQNYEGYNVTLYGKDSELAKNIFNLIPYTFSSDYIEIMSLSNDKIVMMVRDVGHALSIEIEKDSENNYNIKYFIPKICNVDMVNSLKGVSKVTKESKYTVGLFGSTFEKLPYDLVDLMSRVPTDIDMYKEGGIFYDSETVQRRM